jgi:hypothetical protein
MNLYLGQRTGIYRRVCTALFTNTYKSRYLSRDFYCHSTLLSLAPYIGLKPTVEPFPVFRDTCHAPYP